ncbi:hypothetical protein M422DRAFT_775161 [Sphaerobolus stellatus SS14]|nr:hypothetical protein M422DRAFT_775161 [Sphaerobolus stellatus SS14]
MIILSSVSALLQGLFVVNALGFSMSSNALLNPVKMAQHLEAGKPILGEFTSPKTPLASWMSTVHDSTQITAINVPGTHDTCTWNYTGPDESTYRTQDRSVFDQLNSGIRFLDIRFGLDENTGVLRVYHADTLLSSTASLEDVLWGLYFFLDHHPSETLLVSMKVDHGDNSDSVQQTALSYITGSDVSTYWIQSTSLPQSLKAARGKIILFRRFGLDTQFTPVGINVASGWTDNNGDFSIAYNGNQTAYIEDLYQLNGDAPEVSPFTKVETKFTAITTHIENSRAASNTTQVFISFASGYGDGVGDVLSPRGLAEGNTTLGIVGINAKMNSWLSTQKKASRMGIVLYDFFESEPGMVQKTIGL